MVPFDPGLFPFFIMFNIMQTRGGQTVKQPPSVPRLAQLCATKGVLDKGDGGAGDAARRTGGKRRGSARTPRRFAEMASAALTRDKVNVGCFDQGQHFVARLNRQLFAGLFG